MGSWNPNSPLKINSHHSVHSGQGLLPQPLLILVGTDLNNTIFSWSSLSCMSLSFFFFFWRLSTPSFQMSTFPWHISFYFTVGTSSCSIPVYWFFPDIPPSSSSWYLWLLPAFSSSVQCPTLKYMFPWSCHCLSKTCFQSQSYSRPQLSPGYSTPRFLPLLSGADDGQVYSRSMTLGCADGATKHTGCVTV